MNQRIVYAVTSVTTGTQTGLCPPVAVLHLVVAGHVRHTSVFSRQLVLDLVDGIILNVDRPDQHVVGDVVQVAAELQPGAGGADVVRGALALHLRKRRTERDEEVMSGS